MNGIALKWYVQDSDGHIILFDSAGFDSVTRAEKRPVTPEICVTFAWQKANGRPRRITASVREIEFFDPNSGQTRVWYSKAADGSYELFDSKGFNPATSEPLMPVTKEIVAEIMARAAKDAEDTRVREEARQREEAKQRVEAQAREEASQRETARKLNPVQPDTVAPMPQCSGKVQEVFLDQTPRQLNPGGRCSIRFHEVIRGQCINVYDPQGHFLGNDCANDLHLNDVFASHFSAANAKTVHVYYVLCSQRGITTEVVDGCP